MRLFIAEKPSVARAFAQALNERMTNRDGYLESGESIVTWCVGHLVTMCYPEVYDEKYRRWSLETIPFLPETFLYEVIGSVKKQFGIVSGLLHRADVDTIYVCTDAGREGEYIYRLVEMQAGVTGKQRKRVWIDSQTEEEILRGIREAKDLTDYDNLSAAAYLRAKEDYLMGINFSRALTLKYAYSIKNYLNIDKCVISVGRVMTCVLGMVVDREREIRAFQKTPYYGVEGTFSLPQLPADVTAEGADKEASGTDGAPLQPSFTAGFRVAPGSRYEGSPALYNEKGFRTREDALSLMITLGLTGKDGGAQDEVLTGETGARVASVKASKETKNAPLLYNLAELQNDCARLLKISPDQTLAAAQELYEKKLTTYPRTDARVLSTAVAKEIEKNIRGLTDFATVSAYARAVLQHGTHKTIAKTRYVNDKAVTDHYAIIPTGQGIRAIGSLSPVTAKVYELITRRFLSIFYPPAQYEKLALAIEVPVPETPGAQAENGTENGTDDKRYTEYFYANFKTLTAKGYLHVADCALTRKRPDPDAKKKDSAPDAESAEEEGKAAKRAEETNETQTDEAQFALLKTLQKGHALTLTAGRIRENETSPPKRYNSGTLILTMENAGQFIEDEELRAQIKGSGIGTSATRAEILKKLVTIGYLSLNTKTQIITPTQMGEMVYETVLCSMKPLLNPALTASWEKGLTGVADGTITEKEYMEKLDAFVRRRTEGVKGTDYRGMLRSRFDLIAPYYKDAPKKKTAGTTKRRKGKKEQGNGGKLLPKV